MKNLLFVFLFTGLLFSCQKESENKKEGTSAKDTEEFQNADIDSDNSGNIDDAKVYYLLLASNSDNSLKIATELTLQGDDFYGNVDNSVTCYGCSVGCQPVRTQAGYFNCVPDCDNNGCSKAETATSGGAPLKLGEYIGGDFEITANENQIKQQFKSILKKQGHDVNLSNLSIVAQHH